MLKKWRRKFAVLFAMLLAAAVVAGCGAEVAETFPAAVSETASGTVRETAAETNAGTEAEEQASDTALPAETYSETDTGTEEEGQEPAETELSEDGSYTSKDEVALYIHTYGHLPDNYITKKKAEKLGWDSSKGNLWDVAPGMSIGGSGFGNYEKLLPEKDGRKYYECDINYDGGYRGAERIIYSNDGLVFYTGDHYKSFEQLY